MGRPVVAPLVTQRRGLASGGGKGKGKDGAGGGDEEGLFDRLKKTFAEEIEKVWYCTAVVSYGCCAVLGYYHM